MQLWEMTDGELRAELARVEKQSIRRDEIWAEMERLRAELKSVEQESLRHDEIMAQLEERVMLRRSMYEMWRQRRGGHSATDIVEGS